MAGNVIRQEATGVTVESKGGKRVVKHFGTADGGRWKHLVPKGYHPVIVPNERQDGIGLCVADMLDAGYEILTGDPKEVGRLAHTVMICPIADYNERLRYIEEESNPSNAMQFKAQNGATNLKASYQVREAVPLGGTEIIETPTEGRVQDASGEEFTGTFDAPTD